MYEVESKLHRGDARFNLSNIESISEVLFVKSTIEIVLRRRIQCQTKQKLETFEHVNLMEGKNIQNIFHFIYIVRLDEEMGVRKKFENEIT